MKVNANGIQINYEVSGREDGPVVVMSHSLGCNLKMWDVQLEALEPEFRVVRFDTRGHGLSDAPQGKYSLDMLEQDAIALLDALNLDKVHWVGLSMGGMIGQHLAINHSQRLKSLCLCDTGPVVPPESQPSWQERIDQVRKGGMAARVELTFANWFTPAFLKDDPPVLDEIRQQLLSTPVDGYEGCIWAIRSLNCIDRLPEIKTQTLIMVGREDFGTPVEVSQIMHDLIPESKMVIIPDAAHISNIAQPEVFNQELLSFLNSQ